MKTLDKLIEYLENDEAIIAFKKLESKVLENPVYQEKYQEVMNKQKRMVNAREIRPDTFKQAEQDYQAALDALSTYPIVHQYLELQEEINTKIQMISQLIETVINKPFNES